MPSVPTSHLWGSPRPTLVGATSQPRAASLVPISHPWGSPRLSPTQYPHPSPELFLHPPRIPSRCSSSSVRATRVPTHAHPLLSSPTRAPLCSGTCRAQLRAAIGTHRSGAAAPICPLQFCLPPSPAMDFSTAPCSRSSVISSARAALKSSETESYRRDRSVLPALPNEKPPAAARLRAAAQHRRAADVRALNC